MRFCVAFAILAASFASPAISADDLYSEVALEQAFATTAKSEFADIGKTVKQTSRIVGKGTLAKLLTEAGYSVKKEDGNMVSTSVRHKQWAFPVYLSLSVLDDRLIIEMPVTKVDDPANADSSTLLELLSIGDKEEDVYFSFSADESLIELRQVMNNRGITPDSIVEAITGMALAAEEYEETWTLLGESTSPITEESPKSPSDVVTAPKAATASPKLTLMGTWTAALGDDQAFAIELKSDSTFRLVHLKSGKSTVSEGKAKRTGNQLSLEGNDGITIAGDVTQASADAFVFAIAGSDGKPVLSLDFKSAK